MSIDTLREKVGEVSSSSTWTNEQLQDKLDEAGTNENLAAALVWEAKAGGYAELVNTSEGTSNRSLGDLYRNALAMADRYRKLAIGDETPTDTGGGTDVQQGNARVGRIVRA